MKRQLILNGTPMEQAVGFARAVRVGPWISVGGTAPLDAEGRTVGVGDVTRQAARCYEIIDDALRRAGAGWDDVVRTRTLLTNIDDWRAVSEVRKGYCLASKPVDTIVQVARFVDPDWLVEIEVDAVISAES